ncbi:hypothetical protein MSMTP_0028 [Methanosarcina sp. MTP4]|uniref:hypothetical protein n=1 Tax=Methanosarcina sp. MTP4 TaxID=1434100 RepID=UPI00061581B2|nr:hypothetical protein [Methanosarcina sp. MTP4]AKB23497.1 hypothetical protein MSMTP_0028 [Methanosarcina sp. MTP4]
MGCRPVTIKDVTPEVFNCMKKKLQGAGIHVPPGRKGELSGRGIVADYDWDGDSKLTVTITEKPFIIGCNAVAGKIKNFVKECQRK